MTQEPDRIDMLIDQVARLTEGLTEVRLSNEESHRASMAKFEQLREMIERQSQNIDRMANEMATTARQQAQTVDRLIQMMAEK